MIANIVGVSSFIHFEKLLDVFIHNMIYQQRPLSDQTHFTYSVHLEHDTVYWKTNTPRKKISNPIQDYKESKAHSYSQEQAENEN